MKTFQLSICKAMIFLLIALHINPGAMAQKVKIGEESLINIATDHPYKIGEKGIVFEKELFKENASYIALHFKNFDLAPGDYVEFFSTETGESFIYSGKGKVVDDGTKTISDFWTGSIWTDKATIRLYSSAPSKGYGFDIDKVIYGFPDAFGSPSPMEVCGSDDKKQAICYDGTDMYKKSRAVCKIIINNMYVCTGWLLGDEGHVMTNNHCIGNATDARNTQFLFNYEYTNCGGSGQASTDVVATTSTLVKTSDNFDYSLVKLPVNPSSKYGYLSLRSTIPQVGERVYVPQHPGGKRKQIAAYDDKSTASDKHSMIISNSSRRVSYSADTEGGSSGSPVLSYKDNLVVTLHNTGSCSGGNGGNRNDNIIKDLGNSLPHNAVDSNGGGGGGDDGNGGGDGGDNGDGSDCTTSISSFPYSESFESGLGSWAQSTKDNLDWTAKSGATPSSNTGPSKASDGSYYIYVESSGENTGYPNKVANIMSPCFNLSKQSAATASFKYHMYGEYMGTLKLEASKDKGATWTTLWNLSGNQGDSWKSASVKLDKYAGSTVQLRFNATTSSGWTSDFAIDQFEVKTDNSSGSDPGNGNGDYDAVIKEWLELVNKARTDNGLGKVTINPLLSKAAAIQVKDMDDNSYVGHQDSNGNWPDDRVKSVGYSFESVKENVGGGHTSAQDIHDGLMNSSGHRATILDPNWKEIGLAYGGIYYKRPDNPDAHYWVQIFAIPGNPDGGSGDGNDGGSDITKCTSTITALPYSQGFESGLKDWTQNTGDDLDWTIHSGNTPSSYTGPSSAKEGKYYIYVESSTEGKGYPNKSALLSSPCFSLKDTSKFSFDYHMYGATMGTLKLEVSKDDGTTWATLWSKSGDQGNSWQSVSLKLDKYLGATIRLRFNAKTSSGWRSDFAIDNISMTKSASDGDNGGGGDGGNDDVSADLKELLVLVNNSRAQNSKTPC